MILTRTLKVTDGRIARLLEDSRRRRLLLSLVPGERSLKDAADINGMALNLAYYHLGKLVDAGLVRITREEKRAGRPIRFYRARHSAYLVPSSLLRSRPHDRAARALASALDHQRDLAGGGVLFDVDDAGRPRMLQVPGDGPAPLELWRRLPLGKADAERLFDELASVIHRYEGKSRPRAGEWTLHVALARTDR